MSSHLARRKRSIRGPSEHGRLVHRTSKLEPWITSFFTNRRDGFQITETEGHPFKHRFTKREGDVGGPFRTQKNETVISPLLSQHMSDVSSSAIGYTYDGTFTVPFKGAGEKGSTLFPIGLSNEVIPSTDLDTKGAEAVALANPINPLNDAATFLSEAFREGIPTIPGIQSWESRTNALLGISKEFLNAEFGWLPMVREMKDFAESISKMSEVLEQYEKDKGKLVRRSWYFPIERSSTVETNAPHVGNTPIFGGSGTVTEIGDLNWPTGRVDLTKRRERKLWFKGAFTYTIPDGFFSGLYSSASSANKLLGSTFTPETIWELTPWSWAVDWFSNAQEVITNLQNLEIEGLVMPYGYMMSETIARDTYSFVRTGQSGLSKSPPSIIVPDTSFVSTKKEREQANPFGFGLEFSDLTPIQLAILAALGITFAL